MIEVPIQIVNNDQNFSNYDMIFDIGSEYNYVNRSIVNKENLQIVSVPQFKLISAVGENIIKEKTEIKFTFLNNRTEFIEEFFITAENNFNMVVGNIFFIKHSCVYNFSTKMISVGNILINMNFSEEKNAIKDYSNNLIDKFCYVNEKQKIVNKINKLNGNAKIGCFEKVLFPIKLVKEEIIQEKQYVVPIKYRDKVREILNELLDQKIIKLSESKFTSPAFVIQKPDGDLRLVVDFRKLNQITEKINFPFPDLHDQLLELEGSKIFSQLDLKSLFTT